MFLVSHALDTMAQHCSRVTRMELTHVFAEGVPDAIVVRYRASQTV